MGVFNINQLKKHLGPYVVYLTMYKGDKLPMWYIGSSHVNKVLNGYNGSVASHKWKDIYWKEQSEHPELFKTRILSYHETRRDAFREENRVQHLHSVVKNEKYFNEAYATKNGFKNGQYDENGIYRNNSKSRLVTIMKPDGQGNTIAKISGLKMANTRKNKINELGLNDFELLSITQSQIMNTKHNGILESKRRSILANKTKKDRGVSYEMSKNPKAKNIHIFNSNGDLIFKCNGNFKYICNLNNLPFKVLRNSYVNGGTPIYNKNKPINIDNIKYKGWYAKEIK